LYQGDGEVIAIAGPLWIFGPVAQINTTASTKLFMALSRIEFSASAPALARDQARDIRTPRPFGVAGGVAMCCWLNREAAEARKHMSKSDWECTGCRPGEPDDACLDAFDQAAALLRRGGPLWPELVRAARTMITEWKMEERFRDWEHDVKLRDALGRDFCSNGLRSMVS
jgi:hypothetical protein